MLSRQFWLGIWTAVSMLGCQIMPDAAHGQVIPDGTTPTPNPGDCTATCTVTGGTEDITNTNLFHSFDQFSIPTGGNVIFDHAPSIRNILTRVTGNDSSLIDGFISTNSGSEANVFLLNPNGIIFGPDGGLDIGGSFVATTADALQFGNQGNFSSTDTANDLTLLTINPSAFIFNQTTPQPIISQSVAPNPVLFFLVDGLRVQEGQSLLLVGGDVMVERAENETAPRLQAPGGRIELGGLSNPGIVSLDINDNNLSLNYAENASFPNITIIDSLINPFDGELIITADTVSISSNSNINSETVDEDNAGDVLIRAASSVEFQDSGISSNTQSTGKGGDITILTNLLSLDAQSGLTTNTNGAGDAGRIFLTTESLTLNDRSIISSNAVFPNSSSALDSAGNPGTIQIQTSSLSLDEESVISALTSGGAADANAAGIIQIDASETIALTDGSAINSETRGQRNASEVQLSTAALLIDNSVISASVNEEGDDVSDATGQGGIVAINTQVLSLNNNAQILSSTSGAGNGGKISIPDATSVSIANNSLISTETSALGNGGDIDINTTQLTATAGSRLSATATDTATPSVQSGDVNLNAAQIALSGEQTGVFAETQGAAAAGLVAIGAANTGDFITINFQQGAEISAATSGSGTGGQVNVIAPSSLTLTGNGSLSTLSTGSGPAGDVSIQTNGLFRIQDGARVEVSGESTGDSGTLEAFSAIAIFDGGQLLASTQAGEDGNISLQIQDALVLRGDSKISAEAFNDANGGNVDISSPFIIALLPEGPNGNDIQASAENGDGGRITISTNALFNLAENIATDGNQTNDLDASSGTGIDGEVVIQNLEVDPTEGTEPLTSETSPPTIAEGCSATSSGQFTASGQAGTPSNPYDPISADGIQVDIDPPGQALAQQAPEPLIEAHDWQRNVKGDVVLIAERNNYHSSCQHTVTGAS